MLVLSGDGKDIRQDSGFRNAHLGQAEDQGARVEFCLGSVACTLALIRSKIVGTKNATSHLGIALRCTRRFREGQMSMQL